MSKKKTLENILFLFSMRANCESSVNILWHTIIIHVRYALLKPDMYNLKLQTKICVLSIGKIPELPLIVECFYKF